VPGVSGRAYDGVPSIARVAKRTAYLVTMHVPINRDGTLAKHITDERVVFVAGHEAKHVEQFQTTGYGRGTGERAANAYGNMRARRWGETHEG
jgi:hypothetical protein